MSTAPNLYRLLSETCRPVGEEVDGDNRISGAKQRRKVRDKSVIIASALSMISYGRTRASNSFQVMMGYFCQAEGVSKRAVAAFNHMGICCSYNGVQNAMTSMFRSRVEVELGSVCMG